MVDIVSPEKRSTMMSGIRGKDTKPEIIVRKMLHSGGFRFRLHRKDLPGKPDIVLHKYRSVIFVNGCFWHGHENCRLYRLPKSQQEFWETKVSTNIARDQRKIAELTVSGWKVITVWECALKGSAALGNGKLLSQISAALTGRDTKTDIRSTLFLER